MRSNTEAPIKNTLEELSSIQDPFEGYQNRSRNNSWRIRFQDSKTFLRRRFKELGTLFRRGYLHQQLRNQITNYHWNNRSTDVNPSIYINQANTVLSTDNKYEPDPFYSAGHLAYRIRHPLNTVKELLKLAHLELLENWRETMHPQTF